MARRTSPTPPAPDAAVWEPLYALADRISALAPWEFLDESLLFGVQHPQTERIDYVLTMGELGEHRAIAFYRGSDGLNGILRLKLAGGDEETAAFAHAAMTQDCLMLTFDDRESVSERQRACIKALKRTYRGSGAWPNFQNFAPYRLPWEVPAAEAPWLRTLLEQALEVFTRQREDLSLLPESEPLGPHLVRVCGADGVWRDALLPVAPRAISVPPPPLDRTSLADLHDNRRVGNTLEVGSLPIPGAVDGEGGGAPYFLAVLLVVEPRSGLVVGNDITHLETAPRKAVEILTNVFRQQKLLPAQIAVDSRDLYRALRPLADALDIELTLPEDLPGLEAATEAMAGYFGGGF